MLEKGLLTTMPIKLARRDEGCKKCVFFSSQNKSYSFPKPAFEAGGEGIIIAALEPVRVDRCMYPVCSEDNCRDVNVQHTKST